MDDVQRCMCRERAKWRLKLRFKSLWGFDQLADEPLENHHIAREMFSAETLAVPLSIHRELTRRQMEEHPSTYGADPNNPLEQAGRFDRGLSDLLECLADFRRGNGDCSLRAARRGVLELDESTAIPEPMAQMMARVGHLLIQTAAKGRSPTE